MTNATTTGTTAVQGRPAATRPDLIRMFVIITVQKPTGGNGFAQGTLTAEIDMPRGSAHEKAFRYVCDNVVPEQLRGGNVVFYAIHPAVIA